VGLRCGSWSAPKKRWRATTRQCETVESMKQKAQTIDQKLNKLMQRAVSLHHDGKLDEAEPLYRNYLATWPHNAHVWTNLGALLRSRDRYESSIAAHRKALQIDPGLEAARINLANVLADPAVSRRRRRCAGHCTRPIPTIRSGCATCARRFGDWAAMTRSSPLSMPRKPA